MGTSILNLQDAILNRLKSNQFIVDKGVGVYDYVPKDTGYPRITLGEDTINNWSTKTNYGEDITHTLHVWSQYKGKKEVKEIMNLILESLNEPLSLDSGFLIDFSRVEFMQVLDDPDGITRHGIMRFRFKIRNL
jgi:Protein of unknown function (DUF3168)